MKVHTLVVGPIDTNCYLVEDEASRECLIIDPGDEAETIIESIGQQQLLPKMIVNTHGHFDHVTANLVLKDRYHVPIMFHDKDSFLVNLTIPVKADKYLVDGDVLSIGPLNFKVIHTPGHSPGGICLFEAAQGVLFSGDTLFFNTCGRTDFPYCSPGEMGKSLEKLVALPADTLVYPGHGRPTKIAEERGWILSEISA